MTDFSHRELEKCAAREVAMRRNVFRKRGMTPEREREIAMMEAIAAHFKELADLDDLEIPEASEEWFKRARLKKD
jgi:hypothetical protein